MISLVALVAANALAAHWINAAAHFHNRYTVPLIVAVFRTIREFFKFGSSGLSDMKRGVVNLDIDCFTSGFVNVLIVTVLMMLCVKN